MKHNTFTQIATNSSTLNYTTTQYKKMPKRKSKSNKYHPKSQWSKRQKTINSAREGYSGFLFTCDTHRRREAKRDAFNMLHSAAEHLDELKNFTFVAELEDNQDTTDDNNDDNTKTSSDTTTTNDANDEPTPLQMKRPTAPGLFGLENLVKPEDFTVLTENAVHTINQLVKEIIQRDVELRSNKHFQWTLEEAQRLLDDLDRISYTLCDVVDTAELVRQSHASETFRTAADGIYHGLSDVLAELRYEEIISKEIFKIFIIHFISPKYFVYF